MSDFTQAHARALLAQVKVNQARLMGCALHDFRPSGDTRQLGQRYRCATCEGEVDALAREWYERGMRDILRVR